MKLVIILFAIGLIRSSFSAPVLTDDYADNSRVQFELYSEASHLDKSTGDILKEKYPGYYNLGDEKYELYYCHKNVAHLLNYLFNNGANLEEITVIILQDVLTRNEIDPSFTRFDGEFKWHVFFMHNGVIYDQNIQYGENGLLLQDYFDLMLGPNVDLNDVVIRTVDGKTFHRFFYNERGEYTGYMSSEFIERFLKGDEFPQEKAQYLKWY